MALRGGAGFGLWAKGLLGVHNRGFLLPAPAGGEAAARGPSSGESWAQGPPGGGRGGTEQKGDLRRPDAGPWSLVDRQEGKVGETWGQQECAGTHKPGLGPTRTDWDLCLPSFPLTMVARVLQWLRHGAERVPGPGVVAEGGAGEGLVVGLVVGWCRGCQPAGGRCVCEPQRSVASPALRLSHKNLSCRAPAMG